MRGVLQGALLCAMLIAPFLCTQTRRKPRFLSLASLGSLMSGFSDDAEQEELPKAAVNQSTRSDELNKPVVPNIHSNFPMTPLQMSLLPLMLPPQMAFMPPMHMHSFMPASPLTAMASIEHPLHLPAPSLIFAPPPPLPMHHHHHLLPVYRQLSTHALIAHSPHSLGPIETMVPMRPSMRPIRRLPYADRRQSPVRTINQATGTASTSAALALINASRSRARSDPVPSGSVLSASDLQLLPNGYSRIIVRKAYPSTSGEAELRSTAS